LIEKKIQNENEKIWKFMEQYLSVKCFVDLLKDGYLSVTINHFGYFCCVESREFEN
jgi:hypothetical protein